MLSWLVAFGFGILTAKLWGYVSGYQSATTRSLLAAGLALHHRGKSTAALPLFVEVARMHPRNPLAEEFICAAVENGRNLELIGVLEGMAEASPQNARVNFILAHALKTAGRIEEAQYYLQKVVQSDDGGWRDRALELLES